MKVLVVGASRGTGAELVAELVERGHLVTAYARHAADVDDRVRHVAADVLDRTSLDTAMVGQDAVAVTLGIPDNPFRVRLTRRASSPLDIRSRGTAGVIGAMHAHGVRRLVVQSTYGVGATYAHLPAALKMFLTVALRPQIDDHERQEQLVRESGLDWTIVRPTVLHGDSTESPAYVGTDDHAPTMRVSRRQVARVEADALERDELAGQVLTVTELAAA
jgi:uncharacterized protein YbjT (DUF2867 family)